MHNMSDIIEQYIKKLFEESNEDVVEIQRANIAQRFDCVPSQLNYVIKTRFTNEHGYEIEVNEVVEVISESPKLKIKMQRGILIICCKSLGHPFPNNKLTIF